MSLSLSDKEQSQNSEIIKNTMSKPWYKTTHTAKQCYCQVYRNKNTNVLLDALKISSWTHHSLGLRITFPKFILKDVRCKLYSSIFIVLFHYNVEQPGSATSTTYHTHTKAQNCSNLMNSHTIFNAVCLTKGKKAYCLPCIVNICYNWYVSMCILISLIDAACLATL